MSFKNVKNYFSTALISGIILPLFTITACGGGGGGGGSNSTADTTPPSISSTNPLEGATGVTLNSGISVTFSEAIDSSTIDTDSFEVSDGTTSLSGTVTLNTDKKNAVFIPSSNMANNTSYTITVHSSVADLAGNKLGADKTSGFTTGAATDTTPPAVSVNPVSGAANISVSGNIVLTFSEAMNCLTINNTTVKLLKGGVEVAAVVSYDSGINAATINPSVDLDYDASYTVKVYTGAKDLSNVALGSEFTSTFTTVQDSTPPSVLSHIPLTNAANIAKSSNITLTFNKRLDPLTVTASTVTIVKKSDLSAVNCTVTYDDSTKIVTVDPAGDLETGPTVYTVRASTGIKDRNSRAMSSNVSWDFTTTDGTAPTVSSFNPVNGSAGYSVKTGYSVTFSEDIDTDTLMDNVDLVDSSGEGIDATFTYTIGTKTVTIVPDYNLNYGSVYTIKVGSGIKDEAGNLISSAVQSSFTTKERKLTIMYYGDADNDLESYILNDIAEMKSGYVDDQGVDLILIVDRAPDYTANSIILNENFEDTRMFRISNRKAERIQGGVNFSDIMDASDYEANMGDANTLKKFIKSCKAQYPAGKYALILSNHGGGAKSAKSSTGGVSAKGSGMITKDICYDETSGDDFLNTAEITDVLTLSESVDLFGLDACFMSSIEFAYQFRKDVSNTGFYASIMVASAPTEWGDGWDYINILKRLKSGGGNNGTQDKTLGGFELYFDPQTITVQQLGAVIVEEQRDSTAGSGLTEQRQSLTCLDLAQVTAVKTAVDSMAVKLSAENEKSDLEGLRGNAPTASRLHYFDASDATEWVAYPLFDLYNLAAAINNSSSFSTGIRTNAASVQTAVNAFVLYSFANSAYSGFLEGYHGVHIFFPDGDYMVTIGANPSSPCWTYQWWYNSIDLSSYSGYGKIAWCIDGQNSAVNTVGNWFELLDSWYDTSNDLDGGLNVYQW